MDNNEYLYRELVRIVRFAQACACEAPQTSDVPYICQYCEVLAGPLYEAITDAITRAHEDFRASD